MRVHVITNHKPRPKAGDRKTVRGREYVRVLRPAMFRGQVIGHQVRNGRPLFDWIEVTP